MRHIQVWISGLDFSVTTYNRGLLEHFHQWYLYKINKYFYLHQGYLYVNLFKIRGQSIYCLDDRYSEKSENILFFKKFYGQGKGMGNFRGQQTCKILGVRL